jgi:hypothetical protein
MTRPFILSFITDPFGGDPEDYREVKDLLEKCLPSLLAYMDQIWKEA